MTERVPKSVGVTGAVLCVLLLVYLAYSRPGYFTSQTYLEGLLLLEFLFVAVWMYRRVFFPLVIMAFLFAGSNLPLGSVWTAARWLFLGVGALVGSIIMLKDLRHHFGLFHVIAVFAVLAAVVSAGVSRYPSFALLKALSFLLLFLYGATGARLAVAGREGDFFAGLLTGCECFVAGTALLYVVGIDAMGNPNSLGAVMGVVGAPILLWGTLVGEQSVRRRRLILFAVCLYLTYQSHARAGIAAAVVSCGLLCLVLRKYKLLTQGLGVIFILIAVSAILRPEAFSNTAHDLTSSVVYKGIDPQLGFLASRQSPWQDAMDSIRSHFWFGTGFGTSDKGPDAGAQLGRFASSYSVTTEYGSSYLAITTWVGVLGVIPFFLLILLLLGRIIRAATATIRTQNPFDPALPLAMVLLAGFVHAALEDWLFAPGYYLCVFFWSLAFIFVDIAASQVPSPSSRTSVRRRRTMPQIALGVAPGP